MDDDGRWPRSVYRAGDEPDPRFSFANERTFLAWIRTAVALLALGAALEGLGVPVADGPRLILVTVLVTLGALASAGGFFRWARVERALRLSEHLPAPRLAAVLAFGLVVVGAVAVVAILVG